MTLISVMLVLTAEASSLPKSAVTYTIENGTLAQSIAPLIKSKGGLVVGKQVLKQKTPLTIPRGHVQGADLDPTGSFAILRVLGESDVPYQVFVKTSPLKVVLTVRGVLSSPTFTRNGRNFYVGMVSNETSKGTGLAINLASGQILEIEPFARTIEDPANGALVRVRANDDAAPDHFSADWSFVFPNNPPPTEHFKKIVSRIVSRANQQQLDISRVHLLGTGGDSWVSLFEKICDEREGAYIQRSTSSFGNYLYTAEGGGYYFQPISITSEGLITAVGADQAAIETKRHKSELAIFQWNSKTGEVTSRPLSGEKSLGSAWYLR